MMLGPYLNSGDQPEANIIYDNLFGAVEGFLNVGFEGFAHKANTWNTEKSDGPNVVGRPYLGGNFWADYEGSDENGDGLGDTPYAVVYDNADQRPLVMKTVNSTGDAPDADPDDGMCHTGSTIDRDGTSEPECTIRAAIEQANARDGWNRIFFDIPGDGIPVIFPRSSVSGNNGHGIHAMGSGNRNWAAEMEDMTLAGNQGHGLYSEDGYMILGGCRFYGNVQSGVGVESGNVLARDIMSSQNWGDGIYCNGAETCEQGACKDGAPPCSEDGLFCNGVVWCDEDSETCKTTPVPCDASGLSCDEANDACLCDSSLSRGSPRSCKS